MMVVSVCAPAIGERMSGKFSVREVHLKFLNGSVCSLYCSIDLQFSKKKKKYET